ncbi:MAG: membrane lipoprotein lipid attachment site-containing protein [Alistipes sp.]|nr:membrane lipoprotein lipid attachment site-containing protein [Alistipes sp.]
MKRIILYLVLILSLSSCSVTNYMQVATLRSNNVSLKDGCYLYVDEAVRVEYVFNTEDGVFTFEVMNLTDGDIYIDMEKSIFVYNQQAYDYAGRDLYTTTYAGAAVTTTSGYMSNGGGSVSGVGTTKIYGEASTVSQKLAKKILIPKGCYRTFYGFDINEEIYRQMFFARNPGPKEEVFILRENMHCPIDFSNIIYIICDTQEFVVKNDFEVAGIHNICVTENMYLYINPSEYYIKYTDNDIKVYTSPSYSVIYDDRTAESSNVNVSKTKSRRITMN